MKITQEKIPDFTSRFEELLKSPELKKSFEEGKPFETKINLSKFNEEEIAFISSLEGISGAGDIKVEKIGPELSISINFGDPIAKLMVESVAKLQGITF